MLNLITEIQENQIKNDLGSVNASRNLHSLGDDEIAEEKQTIFATSGTSTGESTRSPVMNYNLDYYRRMNGKIYSLAGVEEDDVALNLGAPMPHISGWAIREGMREAASGVANSSYEDFYEIEGTLEEILEVNKKEVTAMVSMPRVALGAGKSIEDSFGDPKDIFPNLRVGIFSGDNVDKKSREKLREMFGFEKVVEGYASSEMVGLSAGAVDESSQMIPLIDHLIFEVIPDKEYRENYGSEPVDIRNIDEPIIGDLVVTDPFRESFDFTRYLVGDKMKVYPKRESSPEQRIPTLEFMGRSGEVLNFGGANVHEEQISSTLRAIYDRPISWGINKIESENSEGIIIELYVENPEILEAEAVQSNLAKFVPSIEEAYKLDIVESIEIRNISSYEIERESKTDRINM